MNQHFTSALVLGTAGFGLYTSVKSSLLERRLAPRAAAGDEAAASSVTQSTYGHALLGIPNSDLATAYYVMLLSLFATGTIRKQPLLNATRLVAWGTSCFSVYLIYSLYFELHQRCPVCMRAHANNLLLTLVLQFAMETR